MKLDYLNIKVIRHLSPPFKLTFNKAETNIMVYYLIQDIKLHIMQKKNSIKNIPLILIIINL